MRNYKRKLRKTAFILMATAMVMLPLSCKTVDLRTDTIMEASSTEKEIQVKKGYQFLEAAWKAQGMDKLESHKNYEFTGLESWRSMMGKMANPWRVNNVNLTFRYAINTFDGRVEIASGKDAGEFFGLQSWEYYEGNKATPANFDLKKDKKRAFAVPTFHYFMELPNRLMQAPIKEYAGSDTILGQEYEMVIVTWGDDSEPTKEHDQYLVYINKDTKLIEIVSYSAHEGYLPGKHSLFGSIRYSDFKNIEGILIPMKHESIFGNIKKEKKPIHTLQINSFEFDKVNQKILYPNPNLKKVGNNKINTDE
ncbi:hypothetical protein [uncultured Aquimarina sp.]|uniref:hypothetical protein n=1 Tax=uncultured Aquimarina sp. TaxID=575652 RepID=UPI002630493E|nr:hypothetical protein [uncultured Aquimarina sp.]